jgi:hypothetical protein
MPTVAISYRRSDSAAVAGRIFDRLEAHYGERSVFMDIDNIPFGVDFRSHIRETLLRTDVLIALIGRAWLGGNAGGTARIKEPADPVRVEIEIALERNAPIIPVLIDGAKMPDSAELPDTFGNFAYLNAAEVSSGRDFHAHMERLIGAIDRVATPSAAPGPLTSRPQLAGTADKPSAPKWRDDALRYFLLPLVVLLVAHYAIVNSFNLNTNYLRFACALVPFAAGFALLWIGERGVAAAAAVASALGLVGAAAMTVSESLYSGDPILPQTRFEWLDNFQFAATIALGFIVGHLAGRMCRALLRRGSGEAEMKK